MSLRIWDVEHGACAMLHHTLNGVAGRLAMIDCGSTDDWNPAAYIQGPTFRRERLDYLFITNADQDHMNGLQGLWDAGVYVAVMHHNPTFGPAAFGAVKRRSDR
jgi:glyoxylase-like metal-dependent hydrolase (beta-lactamase superfamily II)